MALTGRDKQEGQDITTAVLWERVCDGNARTLIPTGGERAAKPSRTRLPQDVEDALGRRRGATAVARSGVSAGDAEDRPWARRALRGASQRCVSET